MRLAGACAALLLVATAHLQAQTSLTIYQDGRVLVRRTFPVAVPQGTSMATVDLGARSADLGTLVALDEGVQVLGATSVEATGQEPALRRALGHEISFLVPRGDSTRFVRGTLLSLDPPAVRIDGLVMYGLPGTPAFPDSLVSLASSVDLSLSASRARPSLRLAYQAQGLQWHATYALVLPADRGGRSSIAGVAVIDNPGGLTFASAEVQLLAGDVAAAQGPRPRFALAELRVDRAATAPAPTEQAVGETHLYTLPRPLSVEPGQTRTAELFDRAEADVEPEYVLRHQAFVYEAAQPQPEQDLHPDIGYVVRRPAGSAFGDTPLPAGTVRVLAPDSAGRLQLLGEAAIQHTPAGRDLHLVTGTAFDITAQRTQTSFQRRGPRESSWSYEVKIQNAKTSAVTVHVRDEFPAQWDLLSSSVPAERQTATSVSFPVSVPAQGEATLEYTVRVRW